MRQKIFWKGIIHRHKFQPPFRIEKHFAVLKRSLDIARRGDLRLIPFLVRIRGEFFLNPLHATHPRKMPAAVFHNFVTAVT